MKPTIQNIKNSKNWSPNPPNQKEWLEKSANGFWWVLFKVTEKDEEVDEETGEKLIWPETWYVDCVQIVEEWLDNGEELIAEGPMLGTINLSNKEDTNGLYWQPVVDPLDNIE